MDLFVPGQGPTGQVHDFNPGILPNGLFWTMQLPRHSFHIEGNGKAARLRIQNLPMPDTFFFANNVSVAGEISVNVKWEATSSPVRRGHGLDATDPFFDKFIGDFSDARCHGHARGAETGFKFRTDRMTAEGFYASLGYERNGKYLEMP